MNRPMKISIAISILILALAAIFGWNGQRTLDSVTRQHRALAKEAAALGLTIGAAGVEGQVLVTKRERADKEAEARLAAKDFIAFALEMQEYKESGEQPDEAMQERIGEFMDRMLSLDAGQLKILIEEFRASNEMEDETRTGMIAFAIMTLANDHPEAALTLFTESEDMFDNQMIGKHLLSSSLANWASTDPEAALEWVRKNGKKHPDLITDDVKAGLVKGAASNGMAMGFSLLGELKMEDPNEAIRALARSVSTPEERTEFLDLLRDYSQTAPKADGIDPSETMGSLADSISKDGFDAGSKWIADSSLTQKEIDSLASSFSHSTKSGDTGKWISWMGESVSAEKREDNISNTMRNWTRTDYRAAGEWLASAPEGATKNTAVKSYAETIAKYDPTTAANGR